MSTDQRPIVRSRSEAHAIGLTRYFTGTPCQHGHTAERMVSNKSCVTCLRTRARRRYFADLEANRAKSRDSARQWHIANKERANARSKIWHTTNRAKANAASAEYYRTNITAAKAANRARYLAQREARLAYRRQYYADNRATILANEQKRGLRLKSEISERLKRHRRANPELYRARENSKRARRARAPGKFTRQDISRIMFLQRNRCAYCPADLKRNAWHVDHIEPIARGGSNFPSNLQMLCAPCNMAKRAKDPIEFARSTGRLL